MASALCLVGATCQIKRLENDFYCLEGGAMKMGGGVGNIT